MMNAGIYLGNKRAAWVVVCARTQTAVQQDFFCGLYPGSKFIKLMVRELPLVHEKKIKRSASISMAKDFS
jgi:hypothetical protein